MEDTSLGFRPLIYVVILLGGAGVGILAPSWGVLALAAYGLAVLLNLIIMLTIAVRRRASRSQVLGSVLGAFVAGIYDFAKIGAVAALVRWLMLAWRG